MESLLGTLGVDLKNFLGQLFNFLIFAYVVNRFVFKPVLAMLEKRNKLIEESVQRAKEADRKVAELKEEQNELVRETRREAATIVANATEKAKQSRAAVLEETRAEAHAMIKDAKQTIAEERVSMLEEVKSEVTSLVLKTAEKFLGERMTPAHDAKLSKHIAKDLEV